MAKARLTLLVPQQNMPVGALTGAQIMLGLGTALRGEKGDRGLQGEDGVDGLSAYQLAVSAGFVGDEAAWLLSLEGPAGAKGDAGAGSTVPGPPGASADLSGDTHAATAKTTPADADEIPLVDSAASWVLKKLTWANLKATLAAYFDGIYQAILVSGTNLKTINSTSLLGSGDIVVSASPGGSTGQVQYNNAGALGGDAGMAYDASTKTLVMGGAYGTTTGSAVQLGADIDLRPYYGLVVAISGSNRFWMSLSGMHLDASKMLLWDSSTVVTSNTPDLGARRASVGVLEINSGTASDFRDIKLRKLIASGSHTDASNGRWLELSMDSAGIAEIKPTGNGTGASGNVLHISGLPTSNPGPGILWNNVGIVAIGT